MNRKPFSIAVAYFIVVIVVAHFFAQPNYTWTSNTISDLAAQGHANKWIMQAGFIGFGLLTTWGVAFHFNKNRRAFFLFLVAIYGLSILMSGIFCTAPIDPSIPYSSSASDLHSTFATIAGISLSLAIFWQIIAAPGKPEKLNHFIFFVLVMGLSGMFGLSENGIVALDKGIIQRLLYLSGLAWLVYQERVFANKGLDRAKA